MSKSETFKKKPTFCFARQEKQASFFTRFYDALELLKEFFYANGRGLDASILQGYDYYIVENQLRVS